MIFDSGITAAALTAVLLNIVFNIIGRTQEAEGPIFSEGPGTGRDLRCRRSPPHRPTQEPRDPALTPRGAVGFPRIRGKPALYPGCFLGTVLVFWVQLGRRPA